MQPKFKRILYGGDYNPNQWPEEIWKEDMRIFKDARINSATINVFSWAKIQPSENEYNFSELDKVVEMLSEENYDIVFATSTAALPGWMVKKYPEVMYTDYEGRPVSYTHLPYLSMMRVFTFASSSFLCLIYLVFLVRS